jgi:hypothetical protein
MLFNYKEGGPSAGRGGGEKGGNDGKGSKASASATTT